MPKAIVPAKPKTAAVVAQQRSSSIRNAAQSPAALAPNILQILRDRIATYELAPGAKLNEYDLAQEFKIPRTRVRDAFLANAHPTAARWLHGSIPLRFSIFMMCVKC